MLRVLQCVAVENRGHVEGKLQCVSSVAVCCEYCSVLQLRIGGMSRANCSVFRVLQCVAGIAVCCS